MLFVCLRWYGCCGAPSHRAFGVKFANYCRKFVLNRKVTYKITVGKLRLKICVKSVYGVEKSRRGYVCPLDVTLCAPTTSTILFPWCFSNRWLKDLQKRGCNLQMKPWKHISYKYKISDMPKIWRCNIHISTTSLKTACKWTKTTKKIW